MKALTQTDALDLHRKAVCEKIINRVAISTEEMKRRVRLHKYLTNRLSCEKSEWFRRATHPATHVWLYLTSEEEKLLLRLKTTAMEVLAAACTRLSYLGGSHGCVLFCVPAIIKRR